MLIPLRGKMMLILRVLEICKLDSTSTIEMIEINACCQSAAVRVKEHHWCDSQEQETKLEQKGTSPFLFLQPCCHPPLAEPTSGIVGKGVE